MAVSSKSIIHYTKNLRTLKSIISDSFFRIKYCNEDIIFSDGDNTARGIAFPVVCFCDLPLTLAKEHIDKYGSYGIGLSKTWAHEHGLNPVLYLEVDSTLSRYLSAHVNKVSDMSENDIDNKEYEAEFYALAQVIGFCKNHAGLLERAGKKTVENYVFYDEREWRYMPNMDKLDYKTYMLDGENYTNNKHHYNEKIKNINLPFNPSDISYIIVKSEKDIPVIVDCLDIRYRSEIPATELQKLYTKIISVNQIHNDF
jgi:hypothetical protein